MLLTNVKAPGPLVLFQNWYFSSMVKWSKSIKIPERAAEIFLNTLYMDQVWHANHYQIIWLLLELNDEKLGSYYTH